MPLLGEVGDLMPLHHDLEHPAVDLPVAQLPGPALVHAQVDDVQPVAEVVKDQARLTVVGPDRTRLPQPVKIVESHLLAPDTAAGHGENPCSSGGGGAANSVTSRSDGPTAAW